MSAFINQQLCISVDILLVFWLGRSSMLCSVMSGFHPMEQEMGIPPATPLPHPPTHLSPDCPTLPPPILHLATPSSTYLLVSTSCFSQQEDGPVPFLTCPFQPPVAPHPPATTHHLPALPTTPALLPRRAHGRAWSAASRVSICPPSLHPWALLAHDLLGHILPGDERGPEGPDHLLDARPLQTTSTTRHQASEWGIRH